MLCFSTNVVWAILAKFHIANKKQVYLLMRDIIVISSARGGQNRYFVSEGGGAHMCLCAFIEYV